MLYDFDHEPDRMSLVQALLLMTYWYETPDDQKDTWHWMGVAISLSHTIGLHRNPEKSLALDMRAKKLWKRIWWSCVVRDRLVALGMRRPTRIKSEHCDVPMLTLGDFDIDMDVSHITLFSEEGESHERAMSRQRQLAILCIEKAKLCVCISHALTAQYSVLNTNQGCLAADGSTKSTMILLPKGRDKDTCEIQRCDAELQEWMDSLPKEAIYRTLRNRDEPVDEVLGLHRNLLHMVYFTTVSALHRPQVLPSSPAPWPSRNMNAALQEISRRKIRQAATEITHLAAELIDLNLVRYLPTYGVTVMLPAIIIHLLDIKSSNHAARERSIEGFTMCMQVMQCLRISYASADYATHFLEAAIKKADIQVSTTRRWRYPQPQPQQSAGSQRVRRRRCSAGKTTRPSSVALAVSHSAETLTPPPDHISIAEDGTMEINHTDCSNNGYVLGDANVSGLFTSPLTNLGSDDAYDIASTTSTPYDHTLSANADNTEDPLVPIKLESFLATTPPLLPSQDDVGQQMLDDAPSPDMIFSATTPPPASIAIPCEGDEYYPLDQVQHSPSTRIDAILGKNMDPFLGHYEDGTEFSLRENGVYGAKLTMLNNSWGGYENDDFVGSRVGNLGHGKFGNGGWMEGGVDVECVSKLLDGTEFELDVIQVLENDP